MNRSETALGSHAAFVFAASALLSCCTPAQAALVLQGLPSSALVTDGITVTSVNVFLVQTLGTTTLTDGGGINQFEIGLSVLAPASGLRPTIASVITNPSFLGAKVQDASSGAMGGSFNDITSGVTASSDRVFLGTYNFTAANGVPSTTYSLQVPAGPFYTYTAAGDDLEGQIAPGQFTLSVPEPTSAGLLAAMFALLTRRPRAATR